MKVFTLLYCRHEQDKEGNFIFIDTFTKGFPGCDLIIYSNDNSESFNEEAGQRLKNIKHSFIKINKEIEHETFIKFLIETNEEPFYLIDPDTIWFEEMPLHFNKALAGRYIPAFYDSYSDAYTFQRIHTSCIYIDPNKIRACLQQVRYLETFDYISPSTYYQDGKIYRHDTLSKLFLYLVHKNQVECFDAEQNKKFAHLFCGTHLSWVGETYPDLIEIHKKARADMEYAKQLKPLQDLFFKDRPWKFILEIQC